MGNSQFNDITGTRTETVAVNSIAADPTRNILLLRAPDNITIESVLLYTGLALTGDNAHRKNFNVVTANPVGGALSEKAVKDYTAGVDTADNGVETLWTPTGTDGDITENNMLLVELEKVGNGFAFCGSFVVKYRVQE